MAIEKPKELKRRQLEEIFSEMLKKPLGIVAAPSGYGKTTVVRAFLSNFPENKNIWISLGHEEVDDVWVWSRITDKFKEINEDFYRQMKELGLPDSAQETDHFIKILRNYLDKPFFLIIDDYHECDSKRINKLLVRLVDEEISLLHIILIGRTYPEIPYEEMFLKGYCMIADQQLMTLSREETEEIFRINGIELSEEEKYSMEEYTDGWIAAVYLSLFEYKRMGSFGLFGGVAHLLKTAIFDKFSPLLQEVCIKMSLFGRFTLEEAVYVTGCEIYPLALSDLANRFGFIQFDYQTKTYEMHSLLKSVALGELDKASYDKKYLYFKCAEWYEKKGDYIQAIVYYRNADKIEEVFRILSGDMRSLLFETAPTIIKDIIEEAPLDIRIKYPAAYLTYIYLVAVKENEEKAKNLLEETKEKYRQIGMDTERYNSLKGELLILETALQFNNMELITASIREAYKLKNGAISAYFRQSILTYGSPQMTMLYHDRPGGLKKTIELEKEYAKYYMKIIGGIDGGWNELFDAEYALLTGDFLRAFEMAKIVETKAIFREQICIIISSFFIQLRCLIYQGKPREFEETMKKFHEQMKGIARPILVIDYELACSFVYANIGRADKMTDWVRDFELGKCSRIIRSIRSGCTAYGMMLSKKEQWVLLDAIAGQLLVPYETAKHMYVILFGYIYKAIASFHLEGAAKAKGYLLKALELAEQDEVRLPFIETSMELQPLIESYEIGNKFYLSMKPHFKQYCHSLKLFEKENEKVVLTGREIELMEYVKAGFRNSDIGEKMHIALVTVEKNLTSIYRKLEVSNRAAAIAKFNEL